MSNYQANIITKSPAVPRGPVANGAAPGMWRLDEVAYWVKQGVWPNPSLIPDPYFPYVSLLLSTTSLTNANNNMFVDSSGVFNPIKRNGNTTQGSVTPYSANWSNYFDGSGDYLSAPSTSGSLGSGDFTVEGWIYCTGNPSGFSTIFSNYSSAGTTAFAIFSQFSSNGKITGYVGGSTFAANDAISYNTWTHVAVVRNSGVARLYINGVAQSATVTYSGSSSGDGIARIGCAGDNPNGTNYQGYISNVRWTIGTAVYTSNFTPPTFALTAISGTSLLTCQSNRFRDASSNNFAITRNGNTLVTDFNPFLSTAPITYNQSDISNLSAYFAGGTDDWLSVPANTALAFGTGDFCMEAWVFCENRSSYRAVMTVIGAVSIVIYGGATMLVLDRTSGAALLSDTSSFPLNQWVHVACSRQSGTMRLFINGELRASATVTTSFSSTDKTYIASWDGFNFRWVGNISNARIVKGAAVYTSAFTPPSAPLTAISGTSLLTCQSPNNFIDNSTNNFPVTVSGFTTLTGNTPFSTGYWSNYFLGTAGNYLSAPNNAAFQFGTGDVTIESWIYITGDSAASPDGNRHATICAGIGASGVSNDFWFYVKGNSTTTGTGLILRTYNSGSEVAVFNTTYSFSKNTWYHVALSRSGNNMYLFIDGALHASTTYAGAITAGTNPLNIGYAQTGGINYNSPFFGNISNLRIVKGTAVYTAPFTVPTSPLTAISGTSILTCQNGRFMDNSTNNFTITQTGTMSTQPFNPFYTSTIASNGGSMYFDGTGDYLDIPTLAGLGGSGNFTIQAWIYPTTVAGDCCIYETRGGSGWVWFINSTGYLQVFDSSAGLQTASTTQLVAYQWTHIALVKNGSTCTYYVNGSAAGTFTLATFQSPSQIRIGARNDAAAAYFGWISGLKTDPAALTISLPTAPQNPSNNTTLLVNGMNAGIYDATAINDMETVGNAQVSYPTPFAPANYYAGSFDGSGDYLSISNNSAFDLSNGNFTLECWVYNNSISGNTGYMGVWSSSYILYRESSSYIFYYQAPGFTGLTATIPAITGAWTHLAVVRNGGTITFYINGTSAGTASIGTTAIAAPSQPFVIGANWNNGSPVFSQNGYISNARLVKGTAVYTSNFTPPTEPLTAISGTSLLTCQNKTFIDNSANAFTVTANGNATAGAIGPFTATGGTSVYFDGSGDWLDLQQNSPVNWLGTGDYTIEFWVYGNSWSTLPVLLEYGRNSTGGTPGLEFYVSTSGGKLDIYGGSTTGTLLASYSSLSTTTWTHVALTRASGSTRLFINGTQSGATASDTTNYNQAYIRIGAFVNGNNSLNGYIDDLRVTKGVARYTTNFTPPTQAFPTL